MLYLLHYGLGLGAFFALLYLAGMAIERLSMPLGAADGLRHPARLVLGTGAWIAFLFALACAGWLGPWGLAAGALLTLAGTWRLRRDLVAELARWRRPDLRDLVPALFLAGCLAPLVLLAASPPVSWDAAVYHLRLPRLFLEHGGFRPVPMSIYSHWPLGLELLFAAAMLVRDYVLAKLVHLGFGLAVVWALVAAGRELAPTQERGRLAGWLAAAFFLANGVVLFELRVAYVDLAVAFFFLAGFLFLERARRGGDAAGCWWLLGGLAAGVLASLKVTGIVGVAVLGALHLGSFARSPRSSLPRFALPVMALWLPWLAKAAVMTGNPVYPFLHGVFGGPDWSPALGERFAAWQRSIGMGREAIDYLLLPLRVVLEGGRGYDRFDGELGRFWIVLVPLALLAAWRRGHLRRPLAAAGLLFLTWAVSSQQMRFLIPMLAPLALAAGLALAELPAWLAARWGGRAGVAAGLGLALGGAAVLVVAVQPFFGPGLRLLEIYRGEERSALLRSAVPPVFDFTNRELPGGSKLLLLNTNQAFFSRHEVLADSFFEASQIADWLAGAAGPEEVRERLAARGVTHVVVERRPRGVPYPRALVELIEDPARAEPIYRSPDGRWLVLRLL